MQKNERTFLSSDGKTPIHVVQWQPETAPRAVVQIAHGVAEYADRYDPFAAWLTEQGFAVVAGDHIGHGQSVAPDAPRLYFGPEGSWHRVVQDLYTLREQTGAAFPGQPYFLLGHSMGSFLTRSYLIRYPGTLDGAILMGTGQMSPVEIAAGQAVAAQESRRLGPDQFSPLVDRLSFASYNKHFAPNRTELDWLSADPDNVDRYQADPLCGGPVSIGLFRELLRGLAYIRDPKNLRHMNLTTPILFISGADDPVGGCGKGVRRAEESFRRAGVRDVRLKLYPGARHEILNDFCQEQVRRDILSWLNAHLPDPA